MSSIRKMERAERAAYERLVSARADLIAALHSDGPVDVNDVSVNERPDVARLRRRVGAYTAQWDAASRRVEQACESRGAAA